jgi:hypothetical protein
MGAVSVGGIALHLRGDVRGVFMDWLRGYRPDLVPVYEEIYARGAYAPREVRDRLAAMVRRRPDLPARGAGFTRGRTVAPARPDPGPPGRVVPGARPAPGRVSVQESLFPGSL